MASATQQDQVAEYAARLREALGLPSGQGGAEGRFPLPSGGKTRGRRAPPGEPPQKRLRAVFADWERLPDELLVLVLRDALFPDALLHVNQLAEGTGREKRSRREFEADLVAGFKMYARAYTDLARVSARVRSLVMAPSMRTMLYAKWFATPAEGLFEEPDPRTAVAPEDFRSRVALAPYPTLETAVGEPLLRATWYPDFLTTLIYNEWQRAISLSTARAVQFLFWVLHDQEYDAVWSDFIEYWRLTTKSVFTRRKNEFFRHLQNAVRRNFGPFRAKDFPLTSDIASAMMFSLGPARRVRELRYQSFHQATLGEMYTDPRKLRHVVPADPSLLNIFTGGRSSWCASCSSATLPGLATSGSRRWRTCGAGGRRRSP